jgi:hypothetical protein
MLYQHCCRLVFNIAFDVYTWFTHQTFTSKFDPTGVTLST